MNISNSNVCALIFSHCQASMYCTSSARQTPDSTGPIQCKGVATPRCVSSCGPRANPHFGASVGLTPIPSQRPVESNSSFCAPFSLSQILRTPETFFFKKRHVCQCNYSGNIYIYYYVYI